MNDVQKTWEQLLPPTGIPYRHTKLVLFRDVTESGCGSAQAATGSMATGQVSPESFTHGTSAQRTQWFRKGLDSGDIGACDTFGVQLP